MKAQESVRAGIAPRKSIPEAARYLGFSERTVRRMIDRGELPAERVGQRMIRIKVADLEALGQEVTPSEVADPIREAALRVVSEAPKLTGAQLDQICALLRGVA